MMGWRVWKGDYRKARERWGMEKIPELLMLWVEGALLPLGITSTILKVLGSVLYMVSDILQGMHTRLKSK